MAEENPPINTQPFVPPNPNPIPNNNAGLTPPDQNEKKSSMDSKAILAIILLIFLYPIGLIMMWFMTKWPKWVKILLTLPIFLAIAIGVLAAFGFYQVSKGNPLTDITPTPEPVACTQEAKLCPDGVTYVGREGPKCEFKACPKETTSTIDTSGWKTFTGDGFSFKYPYGYSAQGQRHEEDYNVFFFESEKQKSEFEKCVKDQVPECNNYSLALRFKTANKSIATSLEKFINETGNDSIGDYETTIFQGYPALKNRFQGLGIVSNIYIDKDQEVFHIFANSIENDELNMEVFDQILSTFQFIE